MQLEKTVQQNIDKWLSGNYDEATKAAIRQMMAENKVDELSDAFHKELASGTGGLRGMMGVGPNRLNRYTVGQATQGLANWLLKTYPGEELRAAISYDSRNNSKDFAQVTADVLSANGVKVHLFKELRPTPALSYAVRHFKCKTGVMVTASHNPKEYNGYKAYDEHGCQFVAPYDQQVLDEVAKVGGIDNVKFEGNPNLIEEIGADFDTLFIDEVVALSAGRAAVEAEADLKIVYTSLHGTGVTMVPRALKQLGFKNVMLVEDQCVPDGNFTHVASPNPEEHAALAEAIALAEKNNADLCIANDPDCDRVGIAVKNNKGEFVLLNGNQIGSLLVDYVADSYKAAGKLLPNHFAVKTIVTTNLIADVAAGHGVKCYETLTGFKYIGELITRLEGQEVFLAGGEESYGYLVGSLVRDKDAVVSSNFIAEMVAYHKQQGSSLFDALLGLYEKYGLYDERLVAITKKGQEGAAEIKAFMQKLRERTPQSLGGEKVITVRDYTTLTEHNLETGETKALTLPVSDVLQFVTAGGSTVSARPSGTEPKIKFYCSIKAPMATADDYDKVKASLDARMDQIMTDLEA